MVVLRSGFRLHFNWSTARLKGMGLELQSFANGVAHVVHEEEIMPFVLQIAPTKTVVQGMDLRVCESVADSLDVGHHDLATRELPREMAVGLREI